MSNRMSKRVTLKRLGSVSKREPMALATDVEGSNIAFPRPEASAYGSDARGIHVLKQRLVLADPKA